MSSPEPFKKYNLDGECLDVLVKMAEAVAGGYRKAVNLLFNGYHPVSSDFEGLDAKYGTCRSDQPAEVLERLVSDVGETIVKSYPRKGVVVTDKGVWVYNCCYSAGETARILHKLSRIYREQGLAAVEDEIALLADSDACGEADP